MTNTKTDDKPNAPEPTKPSMPPLSGHPAPPAYPTPASAPVKRS